MRKPLAHFGLVIGLAGFILVSFGTPLAHAALLPGNFWVNPSFELGSNLDQTNGTPSNWNRGGSDTNICQVTTSKSTSPTHALALVDPSSPIKYGEWYSDVLLSGKASPGDVVYIQWFEMFNIADGDMRVTVRFLDAAGDGPDNHFVVNGQSAGWQGSVASSSFVKRNASLTVRPGAVTMRIALVSGGSEGTTGVYLMDDLSVSLVPPVGEVIYTENFNTNGDGTRYTTKGTGLVLLTIEGNQEPAFWNHNTEVTKRGEIVGIVVPAAARRAVLLFQSGVPEAMLTPDALKLIDNTVAWLTGGTKGKVVISPSAVGEADLLLSQRLTAAGYTVSDDDTTVALPAPATVALAIATSAAIPATRFTRYAAPLLDFNGPNHDDHLTSSIGLANSIFDPGDVTIADTAHPIAAGLPKTFKFVTEAVGLDTVGTTLPEAAKVIATYKYLNPDTGLEEIRPLLAVIEKGDGLLGGAMKNFEGTGFWAGADMNEPTITPDCCNTPEDPRQLTLNPVNVTGKTDVRITVAFAATDIDFENTDFLRIMIDPDGDGPTDFTQLVNFTPPTANDKFFADPEGKNRLSVIFKDVSYKVPDGATQLVVRFEAMSTFFNEIVGIDNVRIHTGDLPTTTTPPAISIARQGANLSVQFTGVLQSSATVDGGWVDVPGAISPHIIQQNDIIGSKFYRSRAR